MRLFDSYSAKGTEMRTFVRKPALAACCVCVALAFGCGKDERTVSTPQGDIKVTKKGDGASVEVTGKDVKISAAGDGKSVALPANFPKDVPIINGGVVRIAAVTGENLSVHLAAPASMAEATKYYEDNLKSQGWKIEATMSMGEATMVSAKKGKRECIVTATKDGNGSVVQLVVSAEGGG